MTDRASELRAQLKTCLKNKDLSYAQVAAEMGAVRKEAQTRGLDYNELLISVCRELKAEKKAGRS